MNPIVILSVVVGLAGFAILAIWIKLLKICRANEVFVISGGRHRDAEGKECGYRIIKGGKALILPLWERLDRLDLTNMIIDVRVKGAYSKGGIPINVQGVANVKIPGQGPTLTHAVMRLLGKDRIEIMAIAKDTLEGNLRGVMAKLTPEQLNEDKIKFAQLLMDEAEEDLHKLGLTLDTLKIQNVWDEVGYLDSIGRIRNAEVQKTALISEAQAQSKSRVNRAENRKVTEIARISAMTSTLRAQTEHQKTEAVTGKDVLVARERGAVSALVAQARADLEVQKARVEQVRRRLQADVVEPARANMEQAVARAQGEATRITEEGRATAEALKQIALMYRQGGPAAREAFLYTKLEPLMKHLISTIGDLHVDRLTVLPGSNGGSSGLGGNLLRLNEELKASMGVDVSRLLPSVATDPHPESELPPPAKKA